MRRLSLDLTGLPPTIKEIDDFLKDQSPNSYEKQVDRLLASPHYGERMAVDWMDLARFADSHGYTVDRLRDMSPWRDWVIKSFNENMSYSDFMTWQLAGDLLPKPTKDQLIATAFNRNHQQNMEGGIVEEEFRVEYVVDRTNTTAQAFMALTAGCAKCHDHKFDPISQKEYYQLTSFFNNVKEAGEISWDDAMPVPTMLLTDAEKDKLIAFMQNNVQQNERALKNVQQSEEKKFQQWLQLAAYKKYSAATFPASMAARFTLQDATLTNSVKPKEHGFMERESGDKELPKIVSTEKGKSILFDGDVWLNLGNVGKYKRSDPFTVGFWLNVPKELSNGVIFHRGDRGLLYDFRGFHLAVKNNKLELEMAHTAPFDAIIKYTQTDIPRNQWIQLTVTYDGSSKANGFKVFLNGSEMQTITDQDNLYKDIMLSGSQPGLQFGAWGRGKGLAGAKANDIVVFDRELTQPEVWQLTDQKKYAHLFSTNLNELSAAEINFLRNFYLSNCSIANQKATTELKNVRAALNDSVEPIKELMIMQEMPTRRPTFILDRGQYDVHKEEVFPDVPKSILPMPANYPHNRLGLAKWLLHPDHPLTARVAVNRYWQMFFGRGLVKTTEDFGNQGELPSHPELLDWLAIRFKESGWNVKALVKLMVMSATYRQQSTTDEHLQNIDPENILLARGPAERLTSEMLRDNALYAAGLLNTKIGGPSVYPYQPDGLWKINGSEYKQDTGANLYRRGLYTVWRRSVTNPTQATFDVDIRTSCIVRRQRTNTPLQALITLNDPTFVEASKVLGEQMVQAKDASTGITNIFRKLTGRKPSALELALLLQLQDKEFKKFSSKISKAKGWLSTGNYKLNPMLAPDKVAANAVVASTILNTDAAITKR